MIAALALAAYIVKPGDTFSGIANTTSTSLTALEAANPGVNYNLIYPGQSLNLPGSQPVQTAPQSQPAASSPSPANLNGIPSGYAGAVAQAESSDNPSAVNGDHIGLYQMTPTLWHLGGGTGYSAQGASAAEQTQVFNNIVHNDINGGTQNWQPYDGVTP